MTTLLPDSYPPGAFVGQVQNKVSYTAHDILVKNKIEQQLCTAALDAAVDTERVLHLPQSSCFMKK